MSEPALSASLDIDAELIDGRLRLLRGDRLAIERDRLNPGGVTALPGALGTVAVQAGGGLTSHELPAALHAATSMGIELADVAAEDAEDVQQVLAWALGDDELARELAELSQRPRQPWNAAEGAAVPPALARRGGAWFDIRLASFHDVEPDGPADRYYVGCRHLRVVVAPDLAVFLWAPVEGDRWAKLPGFRDALPHPHRAHLWSADPVVGHSGQARAARLLQATMRHHEWQRVGFAAALEVLEGELFSSLLSGERLCGGISDEHFRKLQERLGVLAQFLHELQLANRTMARRSHVEPGFPAEIRDELVERCAELERQLEVSRDQLRSTFSVLAELATFQQLAVSQESSRQATRFQTATAVVASAVVGPSLVATFYGGDIRGLPQDGAEREFALVVALSVTMSALVFVLLLACVLLPAAAARRRRRAPLEQPRRRQRHGSHAVPPQRRRPPASIQPAATAEAGPTS